MLDYWVGEGPLIESLISANTQERVSEYINKDKTWSIQLLSQVTLTDLVRQSMAIPLQTLDIQDKMTWKFTQDGNFS